MKLGGLHLLLSYQCTFACDHCFVWGSPFQTGVMRLGDIRAVLDQAEALGPGTAIYFEGGEPFLYFATLIKAVDDAHRRGFRVGIVSNGFWATSLEDALEALKPLAGKLVDLSVSSDLYHYSEKVSQQVQFAEAAARQLGIPTGTISIAQPDDLNAAFVTGKLPEGESGVMYRGRAAVKLAPGAPKVSWQTLTACPYEDLVDPGRVHVDPLGNLHLCQGISIGNLFEQPVSVICERYDPQAHPVVGPLLRGGPRELAETYGVPHAEEYADACQFCYVTRLALRPSFPAVLCPDQIYGVGVD